MVGSFFRAVLPALLAYALLVGWGYLAWQVVVHAPPGKTTGSITVKAAETPVVLGYRELGQRSGPTSASAEHLLIERRGDVWLFGNRSDGKRVLLTTDAGRNRFVNRWALDSGDRLSFPGAEIEIVEVTAERIRLREVATGREATWSGGLEAKGEEVLRICQGMLRRTFAGARWLSRNWGIAGDGELPALTIGGGVSCDDRWQVDELPPGAIRIVWQDGRFLAAPGALRTQTLLIRAGSDTREGFAGIAVPSRGPLGTVESLVVGSTRYRLTDRNDSLVLTPLTNRDFFFLDEESPVNHRLMTWIGGGRDAATWIAGVAPMAAPGLAGAVLLALLMVWLWRRDPGRDVWWFVHGLAAVVPSAIGLWLTLLLVRSTGGPDQGLIVGAAWIAWFWATFMLVWSGRLRGLGGWLWCLATILAGIGIVTQFQLGAGSDNTRWLGFYYKHAAVFALFAWVLAASTILSTEFLRRLWMNIFDREGVVAIAAAVLIVAVVFQFFFGGEEGIAGLQPVELVKTVFITLLGYVGLHVTETRRREVRLYRQSPIAFLMPYFRLAAIFLLFVGAMILGVRDFSPFIVMGIVLIAWAWKLGGAQEDVARRGWWRAVQPAIALGIVALIAIVWWMHGNAHLLPDGFPYKIRFLVWAEPHLYAHSGSQVLASMDAVGQGAWWGAKDWYGQNGPIMRLPAVQDDFITAFLINRFGGIAGLVLLATQLCYIFVLFWLGRVTVRRFGEGDFREQNAGVVLGYVLYGFGWLHIAHWLISWGNTLGLMPVMGQPMSWLSAGNSHLMGYSLLALVIALVTAWLAESYADEARDRARRNAKRGS